MYILLVFAWEYIRFHSVLREVDRSGVVVLSTLPSHRYIHKAHTGSLELGGRIKQRLMG